MSKRILLAATLVLAGFAPLMAIEPDACEGAVLNRIGQLEGETQFQSSEPAWSRERLARLPSMEATALSFQSEPSVVPPPGGITADELDAAIEKAGWSKGGFKIVPYGILWGDMIYASSRQFPGRFILWIDSEETQGEDSFQIEARYTRVGLDVKGPTVDVFGGMAGGGKVEVDFLGNFTTENQPDVRVRHAYYEAKNESARILVGQTWDLISPLLPNTVNFSVLWAAGNIGFRRAQFRLERYIPLSGDVTWELQGALAQNVIQDFTSGTSSVGVTRETGDWPMIQARTGLRFGGGRPNPIAIGVSGHIGETGFDFAGGHPANPGLAAQDDARFRSWSFNVDAKIPLTDRCGVHGEFFTGENLSNELGGILQGVCPCLRVPIRATGGWGEIWFDVTPKVHTHLGYGVDDPNNADSLIGRTSNSVVYSNVFLDCTKQLTTGLEVSYWRTNYHNRTSEPGFTPIASPTLPGDAVAIDWTVRYKF